MWHKIILLGNLGRDPESKYLNSGTMVTNFSVATSEKWTNGSGEAQERTVWWRVAVFGKAGEACNNYLKKGSRVLVEGRVNADASGNPRVYKRQDGEAAASFEVTALTVKFLSAKGEGGGHDQAQGESEEDSIPF